MGAVTDDEVIRKRLLTDGDGAGDDRRINLLAKSFIKWCNSGSQEEGYSQYQRMLSTLSQCEFSMGKTLLVYDMNLREMENFEKIYKEIECSIAGTHKKLLSAKSKFFKRNEYEKISKNMMHWQK
ncbi:hypothetical protein J1605_018456 [Eschrichtius robustus]|uniref:THO complex subunit 7 homolog n=1 Tax=Eschrichtius robustus TaxID=9764 RepID=A0AB34HWT2_ESCRO|nr:hypothetical protein J1605_018456 [Eschrichtius robustus]